MKARVTVSLRPGVLDPQGRAVSKSLSAEGFSEIRDVRIGKVIELEIDEADPVRARVRVEQMCDRLLANPVLERYEIELADTAAAPR